MRRSGWSPDAILTPFHEHLIAGPAVIYKLLQATFGMASNLPYYVVAIATFSLSAALLFAFLRTRVGDWLALFAVLPLLFLGAASEDLLWAFQLCFFGSVAAGVGMLLALDRGGRRADLLAALLATVSLAFSGVGIAFLAAAIVDVALGPAPRRRRAFVAVVPIVAYGLWWLGWGHEAEHNLTFENLVHLPEYLLDAVGAGIAALLGADVQSHSDPKHPPLVFRALAILAAVGVIVKIVREGGVSRRLGVVLAAGLGFWVLAGLDRDFYRPPISGRFQYPSAVFLLLIAGEALRGIRAPRLALVAVGGVAVVAAIGGIRKLESEREVWDYFGGATRAALTGVQIDGPAAPPSYRVVNQSVDVTVAGFRRAAARFGSPTYSEDELSGLEPGYLDVLDRSLAEAASVALVPLGHGAGRGLGDCRSPALGPAGSPAPLPVTSERSILVNRGNKATPVEVIRFGEPPGFEVGTLGPGATAALRLPRGTSPVRWQILAPQSRSFAVCEDRTAAG